MKKYFISKHGKLALMWLCALFTSTMVLAIGYVVNVIKLFGADFSAMNAEVVVRLFGVFIFPLGGVAGYIG
jgi:hypothetical protein